MLYENVAITWNINTLYTNMQLTQVISLVAKLQEREMNKKKWGAALCHDLTLSSTFQEQFRDTQRGILVCILKTDFCQKN